MSTTEKPPATADDLVRAAELMIVAQLGSPRMLARKLQITGEEVEALLDELQLAGVVGAATDTGTRPLLVSSDELEVALKQVRAHAAKRRIVLESEALDEAHGGEVVLRGGLGVAEVHADEPSTELAVRAEGEIAERRDNEIDDYEHDQPHLIGRIIEWPTHVITDLATSDGAKQAGGTALRAGRAALRAAVLTGQGYVSGAKRAYQAATLGDDREQVRLARASGDPDRYDVAKQALKDAQRLRMALLKDLPGAVVGLLGLTVVLCVVLAVLTIVAGVVVWLRPGGIDWTTWWHGVGVALDIAGAVIWWGVIVALCLAVPVSLTVGYKEGKRAGNPPMWLMTQEQRAQVGAEITSDVIVQAFAHAKVPRLTKFLQEGGLLEFIVTPREQGGGTYFRVRFPVGVMAADFLPSPKVELVAGNMSRHKHEYWPQKDPDTDARTLDCWVADKGALDKPAPAWPLLHDGGFDVFRDRLPWGVTMRSEPVQVGMLQKHWLIGATSKQGKSTTLRLLLLGLALDPTVELRIADLKGDGDFSMFRDRAQTLIEGQADEDAEATCTMLEQAVTEMQRRYDRKRSLGIVGSITREMSRRKGSGFHPIYVVVDECQVLYAAPHPIGGTKDDARAWRAAKRLHDQARAVNVHLMQATQRPDNRTLPVQVREGAHVRAALNVPNEEAAKMILADAADRGARPQDLRPGADAGTVVATGEIEDIPKGQAFAIVRTHYVSTEEAYSVIARAMDIMKKAGRTVGSGLLAVCAEPEPVDHLTDINEAMRDEVRVRTQVVLQRLAERDPDTYEPWDFADLKAELERHGVSAVKVRGVMHVRLDDVERAIRDRADEPPPA